MPCGRPSRRPGARSGSSGTSGGAGTGSIVCADRAEQGAKGHHYAKLTAYDAIQAGVLSEDEVEDARRIFEEAGKLSEFEELYLTKASDDGANPFGIKAIRDAVLAVEEAERIVRETVPVAFGVDVARSVDWTVVVGLNALGQVCVFDRWQSPWGETKERIDSLVGENAALVDATGVGDSVVEDLQRGDFAGQYEGFKFTGQSLEAATHGVPGPVDPDGGDRLPGGRDRPGA